MTNNSVKSSLLGLVAAVSFLCSCEESGPFQATEVRVIEPDNTLEMPKIADSDMERFRFSAREPSRAAAPASAGPQLVWDTPEGWEEAPTTQMRDVNLTFGPNGEGEVYLTRLAGAGGGLAANVNRWRKQMGLPDASDEEIEKLPTEKLFNQQATYISLDGTFSGMGGGPKENYAMRGMILSAQGGAVFVKMTGPKEAVEANEEKFIAFAASLDVDFGEDAEDEEQEAEAGDNSKEEK